MANRITRGFGRLGIAAAVLVALGGVMVSGIAAVDQYKRQSIATAPPFDPTKPYEVLNPQSPGMFDDLIPSPASVAAKAAGIGFGITAMLALATWAFFRGLGWVVAGFARDWGRPKDGRGLVHSPAFPAPTRRCKYDSRGARVRNRSRSHTPPECLPRAALSLGGGWWWSDGKRLVLSGVRRT
jgi:hypothetical protein